MPHGLFDVMMGAYNEPEVCELVGNDLLDWQFLRVKVDQNQKKLKSQFNLYSGRMTSK